MKVGIIGGGLTGLTAGYELSKQDHEVMVFEKDTEFGGLVRSIDYNGEPLDMFYHHVFSNDSFLIDLIRELDLESGLNWYVPNNGIYINDTLYPFTTPMDLLRFKELKFNQRIALGLLVLRAWFIRNWEPLDRITAREWIIKHAGIDVYKKIWEPLLKSKFENDADRISGTWIWNKFKLRGTSRGKDIRKELLGYLDGGFFRIAEKLTEKIRNSGGKCISSAAIKRITPKQDGSVEIASDTDSYTVDKLIITIAPPKLAKMEIPLDSDEISALSGITYKANLCMVMELKKPVSDYYWITVADNELPFVLMIEHTNLIKDGRYKNTVVYLSRYLDKENPLFSMDDNKIKRNFIDGFQKMFPDWLRTDLISTRLYRSEFAQPVVTVGYKDIVPDTRLSIPNVYLSSMAQIYPEDRGQNYAIRLGKQISEKVTGGLG